jgi:diguanylate cyclase (GGDEF)-like protein
MDAMSKVGLGFGKGITLPVSSIPEISSLSKSLSDMMNSLSQKDQTINEVSNMADSDPMTDLPNVRAFKKYSMGLWSAIVSGHSGTTVLAIVDLDHFKKINDTFGHPVGDFVLKEVAKILKKTIRSDQFAEKGRLPDFAGRYGGEEFVVVFVNCQKDMYHKGALRLLQALCEKPLIVPKEICGKEKDLELKVTASIGISLWSNSRFKTVDEWMKDADDALYKSKNNGRARVNSNYPEAVEWLP